MLLKIIAQKYVAENCCPKKKLDPYLKILKILKVGLKKNNQNQPKMLEI